MRKKNDLHLPWVILHNTMTLNSSIRGFEADLDIHYRIAADFNAQGYLVGSKTVLDAFVEDPESKDDDYIPEVSPLDIRPYWIVVDSKGKLINILNSFRKMEYIKEIIVLVSKKTPGNYLSFLKKRKYPIIQTGNEFVDYREAFKILRKDFGIHKLLTDSGNTLNNILLKQGLINAISLVVKPVLLSIRQMRLFTGLNLAEKETELELENIEKLEKGHVWLHYQFK